MFKVTGKRQTAGSPISILGYVAKGLWDFGRYALFDSYGDREDYSSLEPYARSLEDQLLNRTDVREVSERTLQEILKENRTVLGAKYDGSDELLVVNNPYNALPKTVKYLLEKSKVSKRAIQDSTIAHEFSHNFAGDDSAAENLGIRLLKYIHNRSGNKTARKLARNALIASSLINRFYGHGQFEDEIGLNIGGIGAEPELQAA